MIGAGLRALGSANSRSATATARTPASPNPRSSGRSRRARSARSVSTDAARVASRWGTSRGSPAIDAAREPATETAGRTPLLRAIDGGVGRAPPGVIRPLEVARSSLVRGRSARGGTGRCRGSGVTRRSFGTVVITGLDDFAATGCRGRPPSVTVEAVRAVGLSTASSIACGGAGASVATGDSVVSARGTNVGSSAIGGSLTGGSTTMAGAAADAGAGGAAGSSACAGSGALGAGTGTGVAGRAGRKSSGSR